VALYERNRSLKDFLLLVTVYKYRSVILHPLKLATVGNDNRFGSGTILASDAFNRVHHIEALNYLPEDCRKKLKTKW
jgi:hypothetical protein